MNEKKTSLFLEDAEKAAPVPGEDGETPVSFADGTISDISSSFVEADPPSTESESVPQENKHDQLLARLRDEVELRSREDAELLAERKSASRKRDGHAAAPSEMPRSLEESELLVPAASGSERLQKADGGGRKKPSPGRRFAGAAGALFRRMYRIPVLGYCIELLVDVFGLPVLLRDMKSRSARKEKVVQARLEGVGNRIASLREALEAGRREMEGRLEEKADASNVARIEGELSRKADEERLESFALTFEAGLSAKSDSRAVEQLRETWERALQELREDLAKKADDGRLDAVEESVRAKADLERVELLGERIDELAGRLDALDGKADSDRVEQIETQLSRKADLELVQQLFPLRDDVEELKTLGGRLEEAAGKAFDALDTKADAARVNSLESMLLLKAGEDAVNSLRKQLENIRGRLVALDGKADLESLKTLETRLSMKADADSLDSFVEQLRELTDQLSLLERKADAGRVEVLESQLALKAGADSVKSLGEQLAAIGESLGEFGKKSDVERLESELSQKADAGTVNTLDEKIDALVTGPLTALDGKADLESLKALERSLSMKADADSLHSFGEQLRELAGQLSLLDGKADAGRVEALESLLTLKADADSVKSLGEQLSAFGESLGEFGRKSDLERLESELSKKADAGVVDFLDEKIDSLVAEQFSLLDGKADLESLKSLERSLSMKADADAVISFGEQLRELAGQLSLLDAKADADRVDALESLLVLKAGTDSVNSLGEKLAAMGESLTGFGKKSDLDRLESMISLKADAGVVNSLDEKIDNLEIEHFTALGEKVDLERVEELESKLALKADADRVETLEFLLALKPDADSIKVMGERLEELSGRLGALDSKADSEELQALEAKLTALGDGLNELGEKMNLEQLEAQLSQKADAGAFRSLEEQFGSLSGKLGSLPSKEDLDRLESLESQIASKADLEIVKSLMSMKIDVEILKSLGKNLEKASGDTLGRLDRKADAKTVREIGDRLSTLAEHLGALDSKKADADAVNEALSSKAEKDVLEGLQESVGDRLDEMQRRIADQGQRTGAEERRLALFREEVKALIATSLERGMRAEVEERFRAHFPYVRKMKERSAGFSLLGTGVGGRSPKASESAENAAAKSRKRVKK